MSSLKEIIKCPECSQLDLDARIKDERLANLFLDSALEVLAHDTPATTNIKNYVPPYVHQTLRILPKHIAKGLEEELSKFEVLKEVLEKSQKKNSEIHSLHPTTISMHMLPFLEKIYEKASQKWQSGCTSEEVLGIAETYPTVWGIKNRERKTYELTVCDFYPLLLNLYELIPPYVSAMINNSNIKKMTIGRQKRLSKWGFDLEKDITLKILWAGLDLGFRMKAGKIITQSAYAPFGAEMTGGEIYVKDAYNTESCSSNKGLISPSFKGGNIFVKDKKTDKWKLIT